MAECKVEYNYKIRGKRKEQIENEDLINFAKMYGAKISDEINEIMAKHQYNKAKEISKSAIDYFYSWGPPHLYKRQESLYDIFDIGITGNNEFYFNVSSDLIGGHRDDEAMLQYDFMQGYHGGMYWRTPTPASINKLGPHSVETLEGRRFASRPWQYIHPDVAHKGKAPFDIINSEWSNYLNSEYLSKQREALYSVMAKYVAMFDWRT